MLFKCNYNVKDLQITSTFYLELLKWWSELREDNALNNDWHYVIWNNRDFRIDDKPFFYKKYYDIGIWEIGDLHFDLSNTESYEQIAKNVKKTNFLEWTSMRHSIPTNLRFLNRSDSSTFNAIPSFKINGGVFDIAKRNQKIIILFWSKRRLVSQIMHKNWSWILIYLMTISERHFSCPILSRLNLMSKPFNLKYLILYFLPTQSCSRLGTGQTTCALFAKGNQKLLDISFGTALIRIHSGNVLNHIILGCENN